MISYDMMYDMMYMISEAFHIKRFGNVDFEAIAHSIVLWYHMIYDMMYMMWCDVYDMMYVCPKLEYRMWAQNICEQIVQRK